MSKSIASSVRVGLPEVPINMPFRMLFLIVEKAKPTRRGGKETIEFTDKLVNCLDCGAPIIIAAAIQELAWQHYIEEQFTPLCDTCYGTSTRVEV